MAEAEEAVRWTVKVSKDTDVSLRPLLAQRGLKKGDLSKFIERAVQKEVFAQTVAAVQARNANVPGERIEEAIEEVLREVRAEGWRDASRERSADALDAQAAVIYFQATRSYSFCDCGWLRPSTATFTGSYLNRPNDTSTGLVTCTVATAGHSLFPSAK